MKTGQNNAKSSGNSDPNACVWTPEVPGGRPLAIGQGSLGRTPPGNSLNPVSSSYFPHNARPLPPCSHAAGNAIIRAEGNANALTALVSAKGHKRASEPLGLQQPHSPGGTEPLLWAGLGVPPLTPETDTADPGFPFSRSQYCQTLSVAAEYFQAKCLPQANFFFFL